jgi:hypothetical protein
MSAGELQFTANLVFVLALGAMIAATLYLSTRIMKPRIPMQWGSNGKPSWYTSKAVGLWSTVALMLAMRIVFFAIEQTHPGASFGIWWVVIALAIGCAATQLLYLWRILKWSRGQ